MKSNTSSSKSALLAIVGFLFLLVAVGGGTIAYFLYSGSTSNETTELIIPRGAKLNQVSEQLAKEGIIDNPEMFKLLLRFTGGSQKVRAGEFKFQKKMRLLDALFALYHSEPIVHQVVIPEGWNVRQMAEILAKENLVDPDRFIDLCLAKESAQKYRLDAPNLEGFLFPDTYAFSRIDGEEKVIERMVQRFFKKFEKSHIEQAKKMGFSLNQIVTLASIIEKETGVGSERPKISSVFHNRLKKKMRLQSDPTTIYGIPNFNGNLTREDLRRYSPYNTYTIPALPPGAIASPGFDALMAAIQPASTSFLYFVANGQGSHIFSETYGQHSRHVNNYQKAPVKKSVRSASKKK